MDGRKAISIVETLREGWYTPPIDYYDQKRGNFEYRSYMCSAIMEIKNYLISHENEDALSVVENFRSMVDSFACRAKNDYTSFMFSIYYDVATDVLDTLLQYNCGKGDD